MNNTRYVLIEKYPYSFSVSPNSFPQFIFKARQCDTVEELCLGFDLFGVPLKEITEKEHQPSDFYIITDIGYNFEYSVGMALFKVAFMRKNVPL